MIDAYRRALPYLALIGLAAAIVLRVEIAGTAGARSPVAGVWFAAVLAAVALVTQDRDRRPGAPHPGAVGAAGIGVGVGFAGAVVLCLPAAIRHLVAGTHAVPLADGYLRWALIVAVVAVAEETLLRGSLYSAIEPRAGTACAIAITSVAFGLLHAPIYGWSVVPLDIAVGVWLGTLRAHTGTVTAPAVAHVLADLAGWWLR